MKTLSAEDCDLFYATFRSLLDFANRRLKVNGLNDIIHADGLDPELVMEISNKIWDDVSLIDDYLASEKIPDVQRDIVSGWKRCVKDTYILERHLKDGSIFIGKEDRVYQVHGIIDSWDVMLEMYPLPLVLRATLLPFKGMIITDGLV